MQNQPDNTSSVRNFLLVGKAEGYSFLLLLFIAMPVKYIFHHPEYVRIAGSIHGVLFIAFMYTLTQIYLDKLLTTKRSAQAFLLSLVPFGTFFLKRLL